jgi:sporulation protein YlmC with PRC-barrel domain
MWRQLVQFGFIFSSIGGWISLDRRSAYCQKPTEDTQRTGTEDQRPRADVRLYSQLLADQKTTKVADILVDLELGYGALVKVAPDDKLLPFTHFVTQKPLSNPVDATSRINRSAVKAVCEACNEKPYWNLLVNQAHGKVDLNQLDLESYELISARSLIPKEVLAADGKEKLGAIVDMAFDMQSGELLYLVLKSKDLLRAVPLGAFEGKATSESWRIDLPGNLVYQFKPFAMNEIPKAIDRGWTEFISVKYGRNGLQSPNAEHDR